MDAMMTPSDNFHAIEPHLQNLTYPLNVYASLVKAEFGDLSGLGYGCMTAAATDISSAQLRMTARLRQAVVEAPGSRLLDVGCGMGRLAQQLAQRGYPVVGIDNNAAALALAQCTLDAGSSSNCAQSTFIHVAFEDFVADQPFDVMIMQNSLRYLQTLTAFNKVQKHLKPGGQLLIFEEFGISNEARKHKHLPEITQTLALAERLGFVLDSCVDVGKEVLPFMRQLLALVCKRAADVASLCDVSRQDTDLLCRALADDILKCEQGAISHFILDLRAPGLVVSNDKLSDVVASELLPGSSLPAENYRELFEKSFNTDFDPALWRWKYADGRGHSVVALQDSQPIAHYGGIRREIYYFGEPDAAVQICDVMVLPERRAFFSKKGLFFKTAATMLEQYAGYGAAHLLGFGFPNIKAMHIAERLGLYEKTDELLSLSCPQNTKADDDAVLVSEADSRQVIDEHADALWARMLEASADRILGVRDRCYLNYRFIERPGINYRCFSVRSVGKIVAMAFVREHGEQYLIMDIVGAMHDISSALKALCRHGHELGRPMVFWITAGQLALFSDCALQTEATGIHLPCNSWSKGPPATRLAGAWWLTAGDMDFM